VDVYSWPLFMRRVLSHVFDEYGCAASEKNLRKLLQSPARLPLCSPLHGYRCAVCYLKNVLSFNEPAC
jgi:hypothetical protein